MHKPEVIFLDMDGVVVDLARSFLRVFGKEHLLDMPEYQTEMNEHMGEVLGMDPDTFWKAIDEGGIEVWSRAPAYPWAQELYNAMQELSDRVVFLTSPSWDPQSLAGKLTWLQEFTGKRGFRDYVITNQKDLLSAPGRILIDDRKSNVDEFLAEGGAAILFPQPWNDAPPPVIGRVRGVVEQITSDRVWRL